MPSLIQNFLSGFIKEGALEVELPSGKLMRFGEPNATAPRIALRESKAQWDRAATYPGFQKSCRI
jgi:hypothetical protein